MKIIFDYNRTIFNPDTDKLYPGVLGLLSKLSSKHELFLISRAEPGRKNKIEKLNIKRYFKKIIFVAEKSQKIFKKITGNEKEIIVVGDSIKDEIRIGNQLGFLTVRLKKGKFSLEIPRNKNEIPNFEISSINQLKNIISSYEK